MEVLGLLITVFAASVFAVSPQEPQRTLCDLKICHCSLGANLTCLCDAKVKEIVLPSKGSGLIPTTVGSITIQNCQHVRIGGRSIYDIFPLRSVTLTNIRNLELEREAFFWDTTTIRETYPGPGIDIFITNSFITEIQPEAFKGHLNSITLNKVNVTSVAPLAFANIAIMDRIDFIDCYIQQFAPKSFNKLILDSFVIEGGFVGNLPSNTMNSVEVTNSLRFQEVYFHTIRSSAFRIDEPQSFKISGCKIVLLEGEAFRVKTKGDIVIDDNIIDNINEGAFIGIQHDPRGGGHKTLVLENNTLTSFQDRALSLNSSSIKIIIDRIVINQPCECSKIKRWSTKLVSYAPDKTSTSYGKFMWCRKGKTDTLVSDFEVKNCAAHHSKVPLVLAIIIGVLIVLICLCSVGFWLYKKHVKQYMNVPTRDNNRASMLSTNSGNHVIVFPQREYKETEIYVMTESVEPIKEETTPQRVAG